MKSKLSSRAFSLVELMVVIAIIGIVSAISLSSLSALQKNNRDSQRQADLRQIQSALQIYYANNNHYPDSLDWTSTAQINDCTGVVPVPPATCTSSHIYLNKMPVDPISGTTTPYYYCAQTPGAIPPAACSGANLGKCQYYSLCATLENPGVPTSCTCSSPASGNFQVTPL